MWSGKNGDIEILHGKLSRLNKNGQWSWNICFSTLRCSASYPPQLSSACLSPAVLLKLWSLHEYVYFEGNSILLIKLLWQLQGQLLFKCKLTFLHVKKVEKGHRLQYLWSLIVFRMDQKVSLYHMFSLFLKWKMSIFCHFGSNSKWSMNSAIYHFEICSAKNIFHGSIVIYCTLCNYSKFRRV